MHLFNIRVVKNPGFTLGNDILNWEDPCFYQCKIRMDVSSKWTYSAYSVIFVQTLSIFSICSSLDEVSLCCADPHTLYRSCSRSCLSCACSWKERKTLYVPTCQRYWHLNFPICWVSWENLSISGRLHAILLISYYAFMPAMIQQPRIPSYGMMQASDVVIRAKEVWAMIFICYFGVC